MCFCVQKNSSYKGYKKEEYARNQGVNISVLVSETVSDFTRFSPKLDLRSKRRFNIALTLGKHWDNTNWKQKPSFFDVVVTVSLVQM